MATRTPIEPQSIKTKEDVKRFFRRIVDDKKHGLNVFVQGGLWLNWNICRMRTL